MTIKNKWYRQEDQNRGSLHVHMAIWIERDADIPEGQVTGLKESREGICGTLPRNCNTPAQRAWRKFVSVVQRHDCRTKCHYKQGEFKGEDFCKYLYPRPQCPKSESPRLNTETERFELTCEIPNEDERLSKL